jgi:hypothetical protein
LYAKGSWQRKIFPRTIPWEEDAFVRVCLLFKGGFMNLRTFVLPIIDGQCDDAALGEFCQLHRITDCTSHFYLHHGEPYWTVLLRYHQPSPTLSANPKTPKKSPPKVDHYYRIADELRPLYLALKNWRNQQAAKEGRPPFVILSNAQVADIVNKMPKSKTALQSIDGIGAATVKKYSTSIFAILHPEATAS